MGNTPGTSSNEQGRTPNERYRYWHQQMEGNYEERGAAARKIIEVENIQDMMGQTRGDIRDLNLPTPEPVKRGSGTMLKGTRLRTIPGLTEARVNRFLKDRPQLTAAFNKALEKNAGTGPGMNEIHITEATLGDLDDLSKALLYEGSERIIRSRMIGEVLKRNNPALQGADLDAAYRHVLEVLRGYALGRDAPRTLAT